MPEIEIIDSAELAKRWKLKVSWVQNNVKPSRTPTDEQIPHLRFGRYVRFEYGSPALEAWRARQREGWGNNGSK